MHGLAYFMSEVALKGLSVSEKRNGGDLALTADFYELTMAAAYYYYSYYETERNYPARKIKGIFELFVRKLPRNRCYVAAAGLEQVLHFLMNMKFSSKQISYLKSTDTFENVGEDFFEYLKKLNFSGSVWAIPEGTVVFPYEPIIRIEAPIIEGQIAETYILAMVNFQSLIASKASRIVTAAKGRPIVEFGSRRAHGPQAALLSARASYIGGCVGTSNTLAGYKLGIPVSGTMAHSYVMFFEKEEEAFIHFNKIFPSGYLLVDTYDTLAAVRKIIRNRINAKGIRLDSGDLYPLSVEARGLLDAAGNTYADTKIMASGDLDEHVIRALVNRGAPIDCFGVGTELSTSRDDPAMNGVYKLVAVRKPTRSSALGENNNYGTDADRVVYKIKTSVGKKTYPGPKQIHRTFENGLIRRDFIALENEKDIPIDSTPLLKKFVDNGKLLFEIPSINEIQKFHLQQVKTLPAQYLDLESVPETYPVVFSERLEDLSKQFRPQ
jgi:nicotinate phosphoribosyltransferase